MNNIVIGIPNNGEIIIEPAMSLIGAVMNDERGLIADVAHCSGPFLDQNRNDIISSFLKIHDSDWLLFLDTDIEITIEQIYALYDIANENNLPLLGGIYFFSKGHRNIDFVPVICKFNGLGENIYSTAESIDYNADYFEVDTLGTGSMLIHRETLQAVTRIDARGNSYWIKTYDEQGTFTMGEDVYFCDRVRSVGLKCYATGRVTPKHYKTLAVGVDYFLRDRK